MGDLIALKNSVWQRAGDALLVVSDESKQIELDDPTGQAEALFSVLSAGPQTVDELQKRLSASQGNVSVEELEEALRVLDSLSLLEDPEGRTTGNHADDERFRSNLAFFELFATRSRSAATMQKDLRTAHVLQLGTGGVGSNVLQHLAGLGIGHVTILDFDLVEPANFARQYLYRHRDIGLSKVWRAAQWLEEYDPEIKVDVVEHRVAGPGDLAGLLAGVDVVSSAIDKPIEVDDWVNEACMGAGVPWVRAGIAGSRLAYFSVNPGVSPCVACRHSMEERIVAGSTIDAAASRLSALMPAVNRAIGPVAGLLGASVAFEVLRYLTGYEIPHAAGAQVFMDASSHLRQWRVDWEADPQCQLCHHARNQLGHAGGRHDH
jgi:molybdopterin-synthase adenylyltransferase